MLRIQSRARGPGPCPLRSARWNLCQLHDLAVQFDPGDSGILKQPGETPGVDPREEDGNRTESPLFTEIRGRGFLRELGQAPTGRPNPTVSRRPCRRRGAQGDENPRPPFAARLRRTALPQGEGDAGTFTGEEYDRTQPHASTSCIPGAQRFAERTARSTSSTSVRLSEMQATSLRQSRKLKTTAAAPTRP